METMKKAIIDQMMLGIFIFVVLIVLGATVTDNTLARDKYYNLKKLTDNSVLAMAKYYVNVNANTQEAEDLADDMLTETKLGIKASNLITYEWDFDVEPATITASIAGYKHKTFWYRFIDLANFNINTESMAEIVQGGELTGTANLVPFGINGCDESKINPVESKVFNLSGQRGYSDKDYIDYTEFYGIDVGDACTPTGNSNWAQFKNAIKDFYVEAGYILNDEELLDVTNETTFCIPTVDSLAKEQNNDPKQISQSFKNLENSYDLEGMQMDIAVFECGSTAENLLIEKFLRVELNSNPSESYIKNKNGYDQFQFDLKIIDSKEANLVKLKH